MLKCETYDMKHIISINRNCCGFQEGRLAEYFEQNSPLFTDPRDPIYTS
jgi:hypothetical protein